MAEYDDVFIRNRISQLRMQKGISEYKMSLDLGHSKGYIQSITSGRALPSMNEFLAICDYLEVTPKDFFNQEITTPALVNRVINYATMMDEECLTALLPILDKLTKPK